MPTKKVQVRAHDRVDGAHVRQHTRRVESAAQYQDELPPEGMPEAEEEQPAAEASAGSKGSGSGSKSSDSKSGDSSGKSGKEG